MILAELHPEVANRSCADCQQWQYNEETGEIETFAGERLRRLLPDKTPCRLPRGCPKGTPEEPRSLNDRNTLAVWHYQQCKAVGRFPNDPIVRQNAAEIASAEKNVAELRRRELAELIKCLIYKSI